MADNLRGARFRRRVCPNWWSGQIYLRTRGRLRCRYGPLALISVTRLGCRQCGIIRELFDAVTAINDVFRLLTLETNFATTFVAVPEHKHEH